MCIRDSITYEPENVSGFEAGVKALVADGSLEVNFDVYSYEYDDLQLNYFNSATFAYRTLNAEESESQGFELQMTYMPQTIDGLRLTAAYGYNDSNYVKFVGPCAGGQLPSEGCNIPDGGLVLQNLNGSKRAHKKDRVTPENNAIWAKEEDKDELKVEYIAKNYDLLKEQASLGSGEHLYAMSTLLGCPYESSKVFAKLTKDKYPVIFGNTKNTNKDILDLMKSGINQNPNLSDSCKIQS